MAVGGVGVQRTGGLVAEQNFGVRRQCTGNGDALLLAAGQLGRVGVGLVGQAHHLQKLTGAFFGVGLLHPGQLHGEADVLQAAALHQQIELLEDHGDLPAARRAARRAMSVSISAPSMTTLPSVGRSSRLMQRTSVDLPAPDMPMMP